MKIHQNSVVMFYIAYNFYFSLHFQVSE